MAGTITALEVQKRNKKRVNVYLDGEYVFSLPLDDAARLRKGQVLSDDDLQALRADDAVKRAIDSAARFLGHRPRSVREVRDNLTEKDTAPPVIDAAIEHLEQLGYLDDRAFATFWVHDRNTFKPVSPRVLRYELRQKGVDNAIIDEVLAEIDAGDAAYRAAEAQAKRMRGLDRKAFAARLSAFLQRRGFAYGEARSALQRLMEQLETDDPAFFAGADTPDWGEDATTEEPLNDDHS